MDSKRAGRPRCRWAAAGPGRASRRRAKRTISNQAPAVWRLPRGLQGRPRCRWAAAGPGRASRRRAKRTISNQAPAVWRPPRGLRGLAAVPVGGGRARADYPAALSSARLEAAAGPAGPGRGAGGRRQGLAGLRDRRLRAEGSRVAISRSGRRPPAHTAPQQPAPTTKRGRDRFPATASSRSISATQQSGTASDQAVMSTWSSTAARPASRRATGTRNGEQDT